MSWTNRTTRAHPFPLEVRLHVSCHRKTDSRRASIQARYQSRRRVVAGNGCCRSIADCRLGPRTPCAADVTNRLTLPSNPFGYGTAIDAASRSQLVCGNSRTDTGIWRSHAQTKRPSSTRLLWAYFAGRVNRTSPFTPFTRPPESPPNCARKPFTTPPTPCWHAACKCGASGATSQSPL